MRRINKLGISTIISTLLVILVGSTLALTLGYSLTSTSHLLSPALTCTEMSINPPIKIKSLSYDDETLQLKVLTERNFNSPSLGDLSFIFGGEVAKEFKCGETCGGCSLPAPGESKNYLFDIEKTGYSVISLKVGDCIADSYYLH